MAKQRRVRARPPAPKAKKSSARLRPTAPAGLAPAPGPARPPQPAAPAVRASYVEAVALYEQGLQALQSRDYARATELLRSVLARYPEEKELHERVRLYLNICERQIAPRPTPVPRSVVERLYAATLALNAGEHDQALGHIQSVIGEEPENDHAHYMRAVALALRGNVAEALLSLIRAIGLNPENRSLARQDPDLESLRQDERFRQALDTVSAAPRHDKRRPSRGRVTR